MVKIIHKIHECSELQNLHEWISAHTAIFHLFFIRAHDLVLQAPTITQSRGISQHTFTLLPALHIERKHYLLKRSRISEYHYALFA